ncbi:hypothetical protein [Streptomyces sp. NPDC101455]|uniref:hypothetical protein n=1 Tax=Streptomyces sp. NPDC101455 TaxID=3366142 RepID=UPI00380E38EE
MSAPSRRPARALGAPAESPSTSSTRTSGRHSPTALKAWGDPRSTHRTPRRGGRTPPAAALAAALAIGGATPALAATTAPPQLVKDPTAYVDPLIGTKNGGNVFPGAVVPFGMLSWSPENTRGSATSTAAPGGYQYDATRIRGFSLTHMSGTGGSGTVDGLGFTRPASPNGRPDNVSAAGQTVQLPQPASALSFVGSAVNGNQQTKATVTYTDGSTDAVDLSFTDWTVGGGGGTVQYGNEVVARTAYRNVAGADKDPVVTYVFATKLFAAPSGKTIKSVTLPDDPDLHVFTLAVN